MADDEPINDDSDTGMTDETESKSGRQQRAGLKQKERGQKATGDDHGRYAGNGGGFESLPDSSGRGPLKSVEGWVIFIKGVHKEAQEDDIYERFSEYGQIQQIHLNLDRRTGFAKGYALVEYDTQGEAEAALRGQHGELMLGQNLAVSWAFSRDVGAGRRR